MAQSKARHVLPLTPPFSPTPLRKKGIEKEKEEREEINMRRKKLVHPEDAKSLQKRSLYTNNLSKKQKGQQDIYIIDGDGGKVC